MQSLANLKEGESARVYELQNTGSIKRRLQDLGLVGGTTVLCAQKSPFGDPIAYVIRGAVIALRREDAQKVIVGN